MLRLLRLLFVALVGFLLAPSAQAQNSGFVFNDCRLDQLPLGTSFPYAKLYYRAVRCGHQPNNGFGTPWISNKSDVLIGLPEDSASAAPFSDGSAANPDAPPDTRFIAVWFPRSKAAIQLDAIDRAAFDAKTGQLNPQQAEAEIAKALNALELLKRETSTVFRGIEDGSTQLQVTVDVKLTWPLQAMDLLLLGSPDGVDLTVASLARSRVSASFYSAIVSLFFAAFGLWFLASGILGYRIFARGKQDARWFAGANGRLSLANTQIALFSVVVFCLMLLQLLRSGILIDLSTDVLYLIGIVSGGSALAKIADTRNERLSWDNWLWLKQNGWFKPRADYGPGQLVRDVHGGFDIPRLQAVAFSVLVAAYLVFEGYDGLAGIVIAPGILGVLGLSQATYIADKAVAPPSWSDYDEQVSTFRSDGLSPGDPEYATRMSKLRDGFEAIFGYRPATEAP